jgi:hypothetical protein
MSLLTHQSLSVFGYQATGRTAVAKPATADYSLGKRQPVYEVPGANQKGGKYKAGTGCHAKSTVAATGTCFFGRGIVTCRHVGSQQE